MNPTRLLSESEMVATGYLRFDIFEESDKNLLDYVSLGDQALDKGRGHLIGRSIRLFQVNVDPLDRTTLRGSKKEIGQVLIDLNFKINSFDFQVLQE